MKSGCETWSTELNSLWNTELERRASVWKRVLHGGARSAGRIVRCRAQCGRWHRLSSHRHRLSMHRHCRIVYRRIVIVYRRVAATVLPILALTSCLVRNKQSSLMLRPHLSDRSEGGFRARDDRLRWCAQGSMGFAFYAARVCAKGLRNRFCPSSIVRLSVRLSCQSVR